MAAVSFPSTPRTALHSIPWTTIGKVLLVASTVSGIAMALLASEFALALGIALYGSALWVWSQSRSLQVTNQQLRTECSQAAEQIKQLQNCTNHEIQTLTTQNKSLLNFHLKVGADVLSNLNTLNEQMAQLNLAATKSVAPPVHTPDFSDKIVDRIQTLTEKQGILFSDLQEQFTKLTLPLVDPTLSSQLTTLIECLTSHSLPKESTSPHPKPAVPRLSLPLREPHRGPSEESSSPRTPKKHAPTPRQAEPVMKNSTLPPQISDVLSKFEQFETRLSQFDHLADLLQQLLEKSRQSSVEPDILLPNVSMVEASPRRVESQSALLTSRPPSTSRMSKFDTKLNQLDNATRILTGILQQISEDRTQRDAFQNSFRTLENRLSDIGERFMTLLQKKEETLDGKLKKVKNMEVTISTELAEFKNTIQEQQKAIERLSLDLSKRNTQHSIPTRTTRNPSLKPKKPSKDGSSNSSGEPGS